MMTRHDWQPARLSHIDLASLCTVLVVMAFTRGFDYATGKDAVSASQALSVVELAAPLWVWSAACLVFGTVLGVGLAARRHFLVWLGHGLLWILYGSLALGVFLSAIDRPWLDGIRSATLLALPTLIHAGLWLRTGPRPSSGPQVVEEYVTSPGGRQ